MANKTEKPNKKPLPRKRVLLWTLLGVAAVAVAVLLAVLWKGGRASSGGLLEELASYRGYSRTVSREEVDFFRSLVEDDCPDGEDLDAYTKEYIGLVDAKFYLGSRLGLCDRFDYDALQLRVEQENTIRAAKIADGQTVYGVTSFTPASYFRYLEAELDADIVAYLASHADKGMEKRAEDYFNAHPDAFRQLDSITYQVEENGESTTVTAERTTLRNLENSDASLSDFLYSAQPGDTMDDQSPEGTARRVTLVETATQMPTFDEARSTALDSWLRAEALDSLYATLAENNPVQFDPNV